MTTPFRRDSFYHRRGGGRKEGEKEIGREGGKQGSNRCMCMYDRNVKTKATKGREGRGKKKGKGKCEGKDGSRRCKKKEGMRPPPHQSKQSIKYHIYESACAFSFPPHLFPASVHALPPFLLILYVVCISPLPWQ
jgi:hypothetical protein